MNLMREYEKLEHSVISVWDMHPLVLICIHQFAETTSKYLILCLNLRHGMTTLLNKPTKKCQNHYIYNYIIRYHISENSHLFAISRRVIMNI